MLKRQLTAFEATMCLRDIDVAVSIHFHCGTSEDGPFERALRTRLSLRGLLRLRRI